MQNTFILKIDQEIQKSDSQKLNEVINQMNELEAKQESHPDLSHALPKDSIQREIEQNNRVAERYTPLVKLSSQEQNITLEQKAEFSPSSVNDGFYKKNQDLITFSFTVVFALYVIYRFSRKK